MAGAPAMPAAARAAHAFRLSSAPYARLEAETERLSEAVLNRTALSRLSLLSSYQTVKKCTCDRTIVPQEAPPLLLKSLGSKANVDPMGRLDNREKRPRPPDCHYKPPVFFNKLDISLMLHDIT